MRTVAVAMDDVSEAVPPKSLPTYRSGLRALEEHLGSRPLSEVSLVDLTSLRDRIHRASGKARVDSARASGRRLRSYDADAHGQGAAENFVRAARFFFRYAVAARWIGQSPADELTAPPRQDAPERPLTERELQDIWSAATGTGRDPDLDGLLLTFLRHTAARREGCLNLTLDHLDHGRLSVVLPEKRGRTRELPLRKSLLAELDAFGRARGADGIGSPVFRYKSGVPLTRRRFNSIFDRVDRHVGWTEPLDVGAHWIRHTTLADIAAVSDVRVAAAFAGHSPGSLGVIGRYTKVTWEDLCEAYEIVFGPRDD